MMVMALTTCIYIAQIIAPNIKPNTSIQLPKVWVFISFLLTTFLTVKLVQPMGGSHYTAADAASNVAGAVMYVPMPLS